MVYSWIDLPVWMIDLLINWLINWWLMPLSELSCYFKKVGLHSFGESSSARREPPTIGRNTDQFLLIKIGVGLTCVLVRDSNLRIDKLVIQ